jgi:predicted Zn-dependent protease
MRIRKEQGLLLVAAAIGLWIWSGSSAGRFSTRLPSNAKPYQAQNPPRDCLAPVLAAPPRIERDAFLEPSETAPLPPTVLPFPELPPLSVVAPPLSPGQGTGAWAQLRVPGGAVEPFAFAESATVGEVEPAEDPPPGPTQEPQARPELTYDSVRTTTGTYWGFVRNADKFALEGKGPFRVPVVMDWVREKTGEIVKLGQEWPPDAVREVVLADTLRHRIERRKRAIGPGVATMRERIAFVDELLEWAQSEDWVHNEALAQAELVIAAAPHDPAGYRVKAKVLRAQADLGAEYALYRGLPAELADSPFQHRGLGELMARLGLEADAERELRLAVEKGPADPRARQSLARFLLARGRPAEALEHALAAHRNRGPLTSDDELFEVIRTLLAVQLALGRAEEAVGLLAQMPTGEGFGARRDYLSGAVDYAQNERARAVQRFTAAREASGSGEAMLAQAACLILDRQWAQAEAVLRQVVDQNPLLRGRALAALGLLYERTGHDGQALAQLEAASIADPADAYVQYLLGRERRRNGQLESAVDALHGALQARGDLIEAMAELTMVYLAMADAAPDQAAEHLYNARQYVERLVEMDAAAHAPPRATLEYRILLGIVAFRARDLKAARAALESGREESEFCRIGLAIVDYAQNRVDEARSRLGDLKDSLRPDDPFRQHAEKLMAVIEDHAEKEQIRDGFERDEVGDNWERKASGALRHAIADGRLVVRGKFSQAKPAEASRVQPKAGNFLAAEALVQLGPEHDAKLAVLQLSTQSRRGTDTDFQVQFGFRGKTPYLRIVDGAEPVQPEIDAADVRAYDPHRLALQVVPKEEGSQSFVLQALIDGRIVHQQELTKLRRGTPSPLSIDLFVEGGPNQNADVAFDDFRLVRRKDKG